jgi:hypothetical protein
MPGMHPLLTVMFVSLVSYMNLNLICFKEQEISPFMWQNNMRLESTRI